MMLCLKGSYRTCPSAQALASRAAASARLAHTPMCTPSASPVTAPMRQALLAQRHLLNVHVSAAEPNLRPVSYDETLADSSSS